MSAPEPKFQVGDWITPNPDFQPSGTRDGRLPLGTSYRVMGVSSSEAYGEPTYAYKVTCQDGGTGRWIEKCWIAGKQSMTMPDPDYSLEDIEIAQQAYEKLK